MSNELLEGVVNLERDAYLKIDIYSLSMIFWELMSRTRLAEGEFEYIHG